MMTLSPVVLAAVLLAAVCHALWNALVKGSSDKLVIQTYVICTPGVLGLLMIPFLPLPAAASWPYLLFSVGIHNLYYYLLISAYRHGDLSQVYPIARGFAPVLVAAGAWLLAGESVTRVQVFALALLCLGIIMLSPLVALLLPRQRYHAGEMKPIGFALGTAGAIALYSVCDGLGVRHAGNSLSYIAWLFFLEAIPLGIATAGLRRGRWRDSFSVAVRPGISGGIVAFIAYALVIWAMGQAPLAVVTGLRETSVLIAVLIGTRLMGEAFGRRRLLAALLVTLGAVLLQFGAATL